MRIIAEYKNDKECYLVSLDDGTHSVADYCEAGAIELFVKEVLLPKLQKIIKNNEESLIK